MDNRYLLKKIFKITSALLFLGYLSVFHLKAYSFNAVRCTFQCRAEGAALAGDGRAAAATGGASSADAPSAGGSASSTEARIQVLIGGIGNTDSFGGQGGGCGGEQYKKSLAVRWKKFCGGEDCITQCPNIRDNTSLRHFINAQCSSLISRNKRKFEVRGVEQCEFKTIGLRTPTRASWTALRLENNLPLPQAVGLPTVGLLPSISDGASSPRSARAPSPTVAEAHLQETAQALSTALTHSLPQIKASLADSSFSLPGDTNAFMLRLLTAARHSPNRLAVSGLSNGDQIQATCLAADCANVRVLILPAMTRQIKKEGAHKQVITNVYELLWEHGEKKESRRVVIGTPKSGIENYDILNEWMRAGNLSRRIPGNVQRVIDKEFNGTLGRVDSWIPILVNERGDARIRFLSPWLGIPLANGERAMWGTRTVRPLTTAEELVELANQLSAQLIQNGFQMYDLKPENVLVRDGQDGRPIYTWVDSATPCWTWAWLECRPGPVPSCTSTQQDYNRVFTPEQANARSRNANAEAIVTTLFYMSGWNANLTQRALGEWKSKQLAESGDTAWGAAVRGVVAKFFPPKRTALFSGAQRFFP